MTSGGCGVFEWRRYTLHTGARETLIELFEREFVESQEAVGARVLGSFRDVGEPDHFVWLRGFTDMTARRRALEAFYGGPVWARHRVAANATMVDSDDVLLLRPVDERSRLPLEPARRPPVGAQGRTRARISATVCPLVPGRGADLARRFASEIEPALRRSRMFVRAAFVTEHTVNDYPALPVRVGEDVLVWLALLQDGDARPSTLDVRRLLAAELAGEPKVSVLEPTVRSLLPD
jgi:NIPSNAP